MDSFKQTLPNQRFYIAKGVPRIPDNTNKFKKTNPGAGHYDIKKIDRGYNMITLGASKGWK